MLDSISSKELQEWKAYFQVKHKREKDAEPAKSGEANKQITF